MVKSLPADIAGGKRGESRGEKTNPVADNSGAQAAVAIAACALAAAKRTELKEKRGENEIP
jgi:hypothetical protein